MRFLKRLKSLQTLGNDISELYEDNIYLTIDCIFLSYCGFKMPNLTLYPTEKGKFLKHHTPFHSRSQGHQDFRLKYVIDTMRVILYEMGY